MQIPKYVSESSVEHLQRLCGQDNPKIESIVNDLRMKEVWINLFRSGATDYESVEFVASAINMSRDFKKLKEDRHLFIKNCRSISKKAADLSVAIRELSKTFGNDDSVGSFLSLELESVNYLLFSSTRSFPTEEKHFSPSNQSAWKKARHLICQVPDISRANMSWAETASEIHAIFPSEADTGHSYEEPSEQTLNFARDAWDVAPLLPDILDRVADITESESNIDFENCIEKETTQLSRKWSKKRDYLRALLLMLFWSETQFLNHFISRKTDLYSVIAKSATVILDSDVDDEVTEADVRQSIAKVLPFILKRASELNAQASDYSVEGLFNRQSKFAKSWSANL